MRIKLDIKPCTYRHFKSLAAELRKQGFKCTAKSLIATALDVSVVNDSKRRDEQNKVSLADEHDNLIEVLDQEQPKAEQE